MSEEADHSEDVSKNNRDSIIMLDTALGYAPKTRLRLSFLDRVLAGALVRMVDAARSVEVELLKKAMKREAISQEKSGYWQGRHSSRQEYFDVDTSSPTLAGQIPTTLRSLGSLYSINGSEKIVSKAVEVFGSAVEADAWFKRQAIALGNAKPIDLLETPLGQKAVMQVLERIELGVYT